MNNHPDLDRYFISVEFTRSRAPGNPFKQTIVLLNILRLSVKEMWYEGFVYD